MTRQSGGSRKTGPRDVGYSPFAFRVWNGMALDAWLRLMKGNWGKVSPARYPAVATIFVTSTFNLIRKWIGIAFIEGRVQKVRIDPDPIFLIGHWRSGTTWLHQTILADPAFAAPTAQACFTPECFLVGSRALGPLLRRIFPTKRPMDNVEIGMHSPEEDEHAILLSGAVSPYRALLFASDPVPGMVTRTEDMAPEDADQWRKVWLTFLRRVQLVNPGKRLVLKSPPHTLRTDEILRLFPDARFIHIVRDPYRILSSVRNAFFAMRASQSLQTRIPDQATIDATVVDSFVRFHEIYHAAKADIPDGQLITVTYEDLKADTPRVMRRIYEALDLGNYDAVAPLFAERSARSRSYQTNPLKLEDELVFVIERRCHDFFKRYGYPKVSERTEGAE